MAGQLAPVPKQQFFDSNGDPLPGAKIYFYASGTSTPLAAYSDAELTVALANPAVCDAGGFLTYYLQPQAYKVVVKNSADVTQYTVDPVDAVPPTNVAVDVAGTAGESMTQDDLLYLSDGSGGNTAGRWYRADADNVYSSSGFILQLGFLMTSTAASAIAAGNTISVRIGGRMTGLSGLTTGTTYYASATAGALTSTAPSNSRRVGIADSTTTLLMTCDPGPLAVRRHSSYIASVGNVGAGEDTLATVTLPAGEMSANSMGYEGTFFGTTTNNANVKTIRVRLIEGANNNILVAFAPTVNEAGFWWLDFKVLRVTTTTYRAGVFATVGPANGAVSRSGTNYTTGTVTWANAATITVTGEATSNDDVVMTGGVVKQIPLGY